MTDSIKWREEVLQRYDKDAAILKILKVLNSRMAIMSKSHRDEVLTLAEGFGITAKDLIEVWADLAMRV